MLTKCFKFKSLNEILTLVILEWQICFEPTIMHFYRKKINIKLPMIVKRWAIKSNVHY